jgi:hypothetical protein
MKIISSHRAGSMLVRAPKFYSELGLNIFDKSLILSIK